MTDENDEHNLSGFPSSTHVASDLGHLGTYEHRNNWVRRNHLTIRQNVMGTGGMSTRLYLGLGADTALEVIEVKSYSVDPCV